MKLKEPIRFLEARMEEQGRFWCDYTTPRKYTLQEYKGIWYGLHQEKDCWVIANSPYIIRASVGYYNCSHFRIDQAIEHFRENETPSYVDMIRPQQIAYNYFMLNGKYE